MDTPPSRPPMSPTRWLVPNRTDIPVIGAFLNPPTIEGEPGAFATRAVWIPTTTVTVDVPEAALPFFLTRIDRRDKHAPLDFAAASPAARRPFAEPLPAPHTEHPEVNGPWRDGYAQLAARRTGATEGSSGSRSPTPRPTRSAGPRRPHELLTSHDRAAALSRLRVAGHLPCDGHT